MFPERGLPSPSVLLFLYFFSSYFCFVLRVFRLPSSVFEQGDQAHPHPRHHDSRRAPHFHPDAVEFGRRKLGRAYETLAPTCLQSSRLRCVRADRRSTLRTNR